MKKIFIVILIILFHTLAFAGGKGSSSSGGTVNVRGYTRSDGTHVRSYDRRAPHSSGNSSSSSELTGSSGNYRGRGIRELRPEERRDYVTPKISSTPSYRNSVSSKNKTIQYQQSRFYTLKPGEKISFRDGVAIKRDSHGRIARSEEAKHDFMKAHPCPATGKSSGSCPGYIVDHIEALKHGGSDTPDNMQWQTVEDAKAKDKWE